MAASNVRKVAFYTRRAGQANFARAGEDDGTASGGARYAVALAGVRPDGTPLEHYALITTFAPNASGNREVNTRFQRAASAVSCARA